MVAIFSINSGYSKHWKGCEYPLQGDVTSWQGKRNIEGRDITSRDNCDSFKLATIFT